MDPEIDALWKKGIAWLEDAGMEAVEISLPHTQFALPVYYILAPAEASSNLARYDGMRYGLRVDGEDLIETYEKTRGEGFGDEVKRRVLIGTYVLSAGYYDAYYLKAQKIRTLIKRDFDQVFEVGRHGEDIIQIHLNRITALPDGEGVGRGRRCQDQIDIFEHLIEIAFDQRPDFLGLEVIGIVVTG